MSSAERLTHHDAAAPAENALERDAYLRTAEIAPATDAVLGRDILQVVGRAYAFDTNVEQRLLAVVQRGNATYNVIETTIDDEVVRAVTRHKPKQRATLTGILGETGLSIPSDGQADAETGQFSIIPDDKGGLRLHNASSEPLIVAVRRDERPPVMHEDLQASKFSVRGMLNGLRRAARMHRRQQQPAAKAYHDGLQNWAVPAVYIESLRQQEQAARLASERSAFPMSDESHAFWERQRAAEAPSFSDQLKEVLIDPEARTNIIQSSAQSILDERTMRSRLTFTEREGLQDLDTFLHTALEVGRESADEKLSAMAQQFKDRVRFLGHKEFETACDGIAKAWLEYVAQSPRHVINLYSEPDERKSHSAVYARIVERFKELSEGSRLTERLREDSDTWQEGDYSKLIVVDDWLISGITMNNQIAKAAAVAKHAGKEGLVQQLEAQVLLMGHGQAEAKHVIGWAGGKMPYVLRGYFETTDPILQYEVSVSGAHSSVDYGFETVLATMRSKMNKHGRKVPLPLLTHVGRAYRDQDVMHDPRQAAMLEQIASYNGELTDIRRNIAVLESAVLSNNLRTANASSTAEFLGTQLAAMRSRRGTLDDARYELAEDYRRDWYRSFET